MWDFFRRGSLAAVQPEVQEPPATKDKAQRPKISTPAIISRFPVTLASFNKRLKGAKLLLCENGNGCGSGGRFLKCPLGFSEKAVFVFCSQFAILRSDDGAYRVYPSVDGRRRRGRQQREVVVGHTLGHRVAAVVGLYFENRNGLSPGKFKKGIYPRQCWYSSSRYVTSRCDAAMQRLNRILSRRSFYFWQFTRHQHLLTCS